MRVHSFFPWLTAIFACSALFLSTTVSSASAAPGVGSAAHVPVFNIQLCAQEEGVTKTQMSQIRTVVADRVHKGFYIGKASIKPSGTTCLNVGIPKHITWIRDLAESLSSMGTFDLGYTSVTKYYPPGTSVRYANEPITNANASSAVFHVVLAPRGIRTSTSKIKRIKGYYYVNLSLTTHGARVFCTFTHRHAKGYAAVVLDHEIITDPPLPAKAICVGGLKLGFPSNVTINSKAGPRAMVADLKFGPLPLGLHYLIT